MSKQTYMIQMNDLEAAEKLRELAKADLRTLGNQVAWLIHQEYARRFDYEDNSDRQQELASASKA